MTTTPRFGLTLGDVLSDHDKRVADAILAALELHDHAGGVRVADPTAAPTGVIAATGGRLAAGVTFFYRAAFIDEFGLETAASAETFFTTTGSIPVPSAPTLATVAGGTLLRGTTYYALSSVDASSDETALSDPALIAITDQNTVQVTGRTFETGTVQYNVWRQGPRATGFTKIGLITNPSTPFVDDGSITDADCNCDPANLPPAVNLTNATSTITLTSPDVSLVSDPLGNIKSWRLYRTLASGNYGKTSLLAEIADTVNPDGTGGLVTTFVDDGTLALQAGQPQEISQSLTPSVIVEPTAKLVTVLPPDTLDDPRNEGELVILLPNYVLYVWDAAFASDTGGWRRMTDTRLVATLPSPTSADRQDGETVLLTTTYQLYVFDGTATRWRQLLANRLVTTLPTNTSGDREDGETAILKPGYRPFVWDGTAAAWRALTPTRLVSSLPGSGQSGETVVLLPDHLLYVWDDALLPTAGWAELGGAGGGVSGDQAPNMMAPDGHHWLVQADATGALVTHQDVAGGTEFGLGRGPVLTSPNSSHYRIGVESDGGLVVFVTRKRFGDAAFESGKGPIVFGTSGTYFRLEVGNDGAISAIAQDDTYTTPPVYTGPWNLIVSTGGVLSTTAGSSGALADFSATARLVLTDSAAVHWQVLVNTSTGVISTAAPGSALVASDLLYAFSAGPILLDTAHAGHRLQVATDGTLTTATP